MLLNVDFNVCCLMKFNISKKLFNYSIKKGKFNTGELAAHRVSLGYVSTLVLIPNSTVLYSGRF